MKLIQVLLFIFVAGCSSKLIQKISKNPNEGNSNLTFEGIDVNKNGVISENEFENAEILAHNYVYDQPIIITLTILGITLISCIVSGSFKK